MWVDLSKLPNHVTDQREMKIQRSYSALITTSFDLYCIGGYYTNYLKECECFNIESKSWNLIASLNNNSYRTTALFAYPSQIITFGCNVTTSFEKLEIDKNGKAGNAWKSFEIANCSKRTYGAAVQLNRNEILIFGGCGGNPEEFMIYDISKNKLTKSAKKFINTNYFTTSKARIVNGKIYIISYYNPSKKLFKIDLKELSFVKEAVNF